MTTLIMPSADRLEELVTQLRASKKLHRKAKAAKAELLRQLSLAEIAEREARTHEDRVHRQICALVGAKPPEVEPVSPLDWDEVWCPNCKRGFVPSVPGGGRRG